MGRSTRMLKVLALTPAVVVSTVLTCLVGALLPPLAGLVLFVGGLPLTALLAAGALDKQAVRVLYGARQLSPAEACALAPAVTQLCQRGLGPPVIRLYVRPAAWGVYSTPAGKKSVLLSGDLVTRVQRGQLPHDQVAALMGGAVGHLMHRHTRFDVALEFWTIPAQLIRAVVMAIAGKPAWQSLTRLAWSTRPVVAGVAIVQAIIEGHPAMGTVLAVVLALTYLTPWWTRQWAQRAQQECDQFVLDHGLGDALSDFLRLRPDPAAFDRIHHLSGTTTRPAPALVRRSN